MLSINASEVVDTGFTQKPNPLANYKTSVFDKGDIDAIVKATNTYSWSDLADKCQCDEDDYIDILLTAKRLFPEASDVISREILENFTPDKDKWAGRLLSLTDIARLYFASCPHENVMYFAMEDLSPTNAKDIAEVIRDRLPKPTVVVINRDVTGGSGIHWYAIAIAPTSSGELGILKMCSEGFKFEDMEYHTSLNNKSYSLMRSTWNCVSELLDQPVTILDMDLDIQADTDRSNCGIFVAFFSYLVFSSMQKLPLDTIMNVMRQFSSDGAEDIRRAIGMDWV